VEIVILDRDGVINDARDETVASPEEWQPLPGSLEAISRLNHAGYRVVIATNQPGIARRKPDIETLNRIHERMYRLLSDVGGTIDAVFFCPHRPKEGCRCRKPATGMMLDIAERLHVSLDGVPFIGDGECDLEAARAVGARAILVRTGEGRSTLDGAADLDGVEVYDDLAAAVDALLAEHAGS